ncbi:MAG: protoporphyrinogen oxidase HemJ [Pseudomonadota bacterium]|nr:protoporphyrinogen oxidase HemJ [Pseudomonadota bacterium]
MENYTFIKALHLISVIAWMAGLLYLPRLYVYHAENSEESILNTTFKIMERRLMLYIMNPAMIASFVFGIWMIALVPELLEDSWMQAKVFLLVAMTGYHGALARWRRFFARDENSLTSKFYRLINEVPTVLMILIVILAIVKPSMMN